MNSFRKSDYTSINRNISLCNKNKFLLFNNTFKKGNIIILPNKLKNNSRNYKSNLHLLTEANLKHKNSIFFQTYNNIKINKKVNIEHQKAHKIIIKKKELFKKKFKELFTDIEKNSYKNSFFNKTSLFAQIRKDKIKIPKVKTQEQLNYYLINDFKEKEPPKIEISKSIKNKRIDEEFETFKTKIKEKNYNNNIYLINEYKKKEAMKLKNSSSLHYNKINLTIIQKRKNKKQLTTIKRISSKKLTSYRPNAIFTDIRANYYRNKEKDNTILNISKN